MWAALDGRRQVEYYKHLTDWFRATGGDTGQVDGITGASVGAGRSLEITLDLPTRCSTRAIPCTSTPRRGHARQPNEVPCR